MLIHFPINFMRNVMSIIFLQQIINGRLLLVVMGEQKSNLNCRFKLESITTYHLYMICCDNVVNVGLFKKKIYLLTCILNLNKNGRS